LNANGGIFKNINIDGRVTSDLVIQGSGQIRNSDDDWSISSSKFTFGDNFSIEKDNGQWILKFGDIKMTKNSIKSGTNWSISKDVFSFNNGAMKISNEDRVTISANGIPEITKYWALSFGNIEISENLIRTTTDAWSINSSTATFGKIAIYQGGNGNAYIASELSANNSKIEFANVRS
jgi:hypothetical protein